MRIGIDIGGTFTDVVGVDVRGSITTVKSLSTPRDPSQGVLDGLELLAGRLQKTLGELLAQTELLIHGTTVATNCLAERRGARVGMITTAGFRDLLELRDGTKASRYDLHAAYPQPLVARPDRIEVAERVRFDGTVQTRLDEDAVLKALSELRNRDVEAVVVGFLHAHVNPAHELRVRELLESTGWRVYTVLSHEILNSEGEYDRFSTAAVNAYVGPRLNGYFSRFENRMREAGATFPIMIMQSTGGLLPIDQAGAYAVGCVTSGPAGGAMASALYARLMDAPLVVTYDTGGTTTDISLIEAGTPLERRKTEHEELKIAVPSIDISVVPLGGGSIARLDSGGILTLGPQSAGADPGPACYARGGILPTLTDANLVLGLLSPKTFLGGRMGLSMELARAAVETLARPLALSIERTALAIHALANVRIAESVRTATLKKGMDPRDMTLLSFGGAGGVHAASVASELSIGRVVIPREASVFSALGFLSADVRLDEQLPIGAQLGADAIPRVLAALDKLKALAARRLEACGFGPERSRLTLFVDCRYKRQTSTLEVAIPADVADADLAELIRQSFSQRYQQYFGHIHADEEPFIDVCRVSAYGVVGQNNRLDEGGSAGNSLPRPGGFSETRDIFMDGWSTVSAHWFDELLVGTKIRGPAIIESATTAILVPSFVVASVDRLGSLVIEQTAKGGRS